MTAPTVPTETRRRTVDPEYAAFFSHVLPHAVRAARRVTGDLASAEDAAAEALARAYLRWSQLRSEPYREAWVLRVATNEAIGLARKRARRERILRRQVRPTTSGSAPSALPGSPDPGPFGADPVVDRWRYTELAQEVRRLPRRQRDVVALRFYADLSTDETADALEISPGSVKTHLHRAIETLRSRLGPDALEGLAQ